MVSVLLRFILVLLIFSYQSGFGQSLPLWLVDNSLLISNVVKVDSDIPGKGDGFGFIIAERNDTLFVVTAKHVVCRNGSDLFTDQMDVRLINNDELFRAQGVKASENHDFALIKLKKQKNYLWSYNSSLSGVTVGDKVGII